ncbi:MAG: glycosyltransferase family 9 protein, partial [Chlorobiaceae bacterium]|nr:glycosyltransferase family 9 protein [Chlorobiaceae bacterium]
MKPRKKKIRQFRQAFARTLQYIGKHRKQLPEFQGPLREVVILARERYGDAIMLTPLVGGLRKRYPEVSITVIAFSKIIYDFFSADPNVTAVYNAKKYEFRYFREVLLKRFDILFNTKDHPS